MTDELNSNEGWTNCSKCGVNVKYNENGYECSDCGNSEC